MKNYLVIIFCFWSLFSAGQIRKQHSVFFDIKNDKRHLRCSIWANYDKKEDIVNNIQKNYDEDGHLEVTMNIQYTYDTLGKVLRVIFIQKNRGEPKRISIDTFTYIYTDIGYEKIGSRGKEIYYLDKNKRIYRNEDFDTAGVLKSIYKYEYDHKGRILKKEWIYKDPNGYEINTYSYLDSTRQKTEHNEYFFRDSIRTSDYLIDLNESSKPIKIKNLNDNSITFSTYDKNDNIVSSKTFNVNNELIYEIKRKITYWQ